MPGRFDRRGRRTAAPPIPRCSPLADCLFCESADGFCRVQTTANAALFPRHHHKSRVHTRGLLGGKMSKDKAIHLIRLISS
jgi:hypothetical protein